MSTQLHPSLRPIAEAKKDGTLYELLVPNEGNGLRNELTSLTVGFNNADDDGEDRWQYAGWSWEQDHFLQMDTADGDPAPTHFREMRPDTLPAGRYIGGSLLPSNDPTILKPLAVKLGEVQVRPLPDLDTHALFLKHDRGECIIAMHPNGYSLRNLAERLAAGDVKRIEQQAEYIVACGGLMSSLAGFKEAA